VPARRSSRRNAAVRPPRCASRCRVPDGDDDVTCGQTDDRRPPTSRPPSCRVLSTVASRPVPSQPDPCRPVSRPVVFYIANGFARLRGCSGSLAVRACDLAMRCYDLRRWYPPPAAASAAAAAALEGEAALKHETRSSATQGQAAGHVSVTTRDGGAGLTGLLSSLSTDGRSGSAVDRELANAYAPSSPPPRVRIIV